MHLYLATSLVAMMQTISCNAIFNEETVTAINQLQSQRIDMKEIRNDFDKMYRSECDDYIFEI